MNFNFTMIFNYLGLATQILSNILGAVQQIATKQPATILPIRTYINGNHVEIVIEVNPIP